MGGLTMRWSRIAFAAMSLALTVACDRAAADTTLRYASPDNPGETLTIESGSDGRLRVEDGRGQMVLTRDGVTYLTAFLPSRERVVVRLDDYMAVGAELRNRLLESGVLERDDSTRYAPRPEGARTIGSWQGTLHSIGPVEAPGMIREIVISTDPALADVQRIAVTGIETFERPSRAVLIYPDAVTRWTSETLARGMPISYEGMNLQSVSREPVPAERFEPPQPILSRDQLRSQMLR